VLSVLFGLPVKATSAADRVPELLADVLGRRPVDATILAGLVCEKVGEGSFHEYKRGLWVTTADVKQELRAQVSGFANAEGGVVIIGIVGGEPSQGAAAWSFEAPTCPDAAGWDEWLGRVLSEISAKTRVEWQVVSVKGVDVVVVAANRAEALIRVYEKPNLVCHLRVGPQTVPIPETLFADLALGRRAKPDLALEQLIVNGNTDSGGFYLNVNFFVHNQGLLWVPDFGAAWCGYARSASQASGSLTRLLDLKPTGRNDLAPVVGDFNIWVRNPIYGGGWMNRPDEKPTQVKPFDLLKLGQKIVGLPVTTESGPWAWYAAIMVLPMNGSPLWAQLAVHGRSGVVIRTKAWPLPQGTAPVLAWFEGDDVPLSPEVFFGLAPSALAG
jgi:hypothetical protein